MSIILRYSGSYRFNFFERKIMGNATVHFMDTIIKKIRNPFTKSCRCSYNVLTRREVITRCERDMRARAKKNKRRLKPIQISRINLHGTYRRCGHRADQNELRNIAQRDDKFRPTSTQKILSGQV